MILYLRKIQKPREDICVEIFQSFLQEISKIFSSENEKINHLFSNQETYIMPESCVNARDSLTISQGFNLKYFVLNSDEL